MCMWCRDVGSCITHLVDWGAAERRVRRIEPGYRFGEVVVDGDDSQLELVFAIRHPRFASLRSFQKEERFPLIPKDRQNLSQVSCACAI